MKPLFNLVKPALLATALVALQMAGIVTSTRAQTLDNIFVQSSAYVYQRSGADLSSVNSCGPFGGSPQGIISQVDSSLVVADSGALYKRNAGTLASIASASGFGTISLLRNQPDGNLVFSGGTSVYQINGTTLDSMNSVSGFTAVYDIAVQPGGNIVVGGAGAGSGGNGWLYLYSGLNLSALASVGPFGVPGLTGVAVQSDGSVLTLDNSSGGYLYKRAGADLGSIGSAGPFGVNNALAVQTNNNVVVFGSPYLFLRSGTNLNAITSNGPFDSGVPLLKLQPNNNVVFGFPGSGDVYLVDSGLNFIASRTGLGTITAMAIQSNGNVVVGNTNGDVHLLNVTNLTDVVPSVNFGAPIASLAVQTALPAPPVAGFSASPTNGLVPSVVQLTDSSSGSISNWLWNFGDGNSTNYATSTNPVHTYAAGTYTVTLTVSGVGGSNTLTLTNLITVRTNVPGLEGYSSSIPNPSITVDDIYVQASGAVYHRSGGDLSAVNSQTGFGGTPQGLIVQPDGNLVVADSGGLYKRDGATLTNLADTSGFVPIGLLRNQPSGNLVFSAGGGLYQGALATLGTLASTNVAGTICAMAVQSSGNVVVGAGQTGYYQDGSTLAGITNYGPFGATAILDIQLQSDDSVLILGDDEYLYWRYSDMSEKPPLSIGPFDANGAFAVQTNNNVVVFGSPYLFLRSGTNLSQITYAGPFDSGSTPFLKLQPNNNVVLGFPSGDLYLRDSGLGNIASRTGLGTITAMAIQSNGNIVVGNTNGDVYLLNATDLTDVVPSVNFGAPIATLAVQTGVTLVNPFANWQLHYFGSTNSPSALATADPDGDGMNNYAEYLAGFNPTNSAAYLHIISAVLSGNDVNVTYLGANGDNTYSPGIASLANVLECANGLGGTNVWTGVATNVLSGGNGLGVVTSAVDAGGATNNVRFYRIRVTNP